MAVAFRFGGGREAGPQHARVYLSEKFPLRAPSIPESRGELRNDCQQGHEAARTASLRRGM